MHNYNYNKLNAALKTVHNACKTIAQTTAQHSFINTVSTYVWGELETECFAEVVKLQQCYVYVLNALLVTMQHKNYINNSLTQNGIAQLAINSIKATNKQALYAKDLLDNFNC